MIRNFLSPPSTRPQGPATWPANFPTCGGSRQSPVALVAKDAVGTNPWIPFNFENYRETPTSQTLLNNGHTAMVMLEQKNPPALFGGDLDGQYNFLQYHFHWGKDSSEGSEHTIDGKKFPGEIHLVHWKASYGSVAEAINFDDGIAVLGIMLELSKTDNAYLNPIFDNLDKITKADAEVKIPPFALNRLLPLNVDDFFRYEGSLTTPTCNEIVIWTVFKDTVKISYKQAPYITFFYSLICSVSHSQLAKFRTLMDEKGNLLVETFRPVQPLNGREVAMGRKSPYWSYVPPFGPSNWADSFPICGSDVRQSPVALVTADAVGEFPRVNLGTKFYDTPPENLILFNNGHTGVFPLEIHLVHWKTSYGSVSESLNFGDGLAVLGIMAEISQKDNPKLQPIIDALANIHEPDEETVVDSFIFRNLLPDNIDSFFRYEGSLTTPTCNEIVIWTVLRNTIPISSKQLAEFRKLRDDGGIFLQNNFRQPLPLNGRQLTITQVLRYWARTITSFFAAAENWPAIFDKCVGDRQSPVALKTSSAVTFTPASFVLNNYDTVPTKMTALNNAHTAQFMLESPSVPFVSGGGLDGNYNFLQFHLHWGADDTLGSEHTIDGQRFPAELHLVHWKASYGSVSGALPNPDGIAVLGVMLEISPNDNPKLQEMINTLADIREAKTEVEITPFALGNVLPSNLNDYFRYLGSLTTPTCNEIVIWTVFKQSIPISSKQVQSRVDLEEFRKLEDESGLKLVDNFRPLQDLAGRTTFSGKLPKIRRTCKRNQT
ncbi:Carbonic anhydrase 2 [Portunus trituberculatus]|uniref:Carbonic anhydrase n=1 Tax=Portunus trituberculatus TaxID=210409 RepID=A0A5B7D555_PORTR|nr:Carbonic anhydrase 2 [Portunus trituberculatus]